ncbi:MAG: hypothetical protein LBT25_06275 [Candidatus Symbiothrix sp.]|jgi:hypothetical protein|nr:hypothetical protein [Candidatus Symbiothrix sp.]
MKTNLCYLTFLFISIFNVSCVSKINNESIENTDNMYNSLVIDSASIMKYSAEELIKINGIPISDEVFLAHQASHERKLLLMYYLEDSDVEIRELIWETDSINRITIWYSVIDNIWKPFTYSFWNIEMEF